MWNFSSSQARGARGQAEPAGGFGAVVATAAIPPPTHTHHHPAAPPVASLPRPAGNIPEAEVHCSELSARCPCAWQRAKAPPVLGHLCVLGCDLLWRHGSTQEGTFGGPPVCAESNGPGCTAASNGRGGWRALTSGGEVGCSLPRAPCDPHRLCFVPVGHPDQVQCRKYPRLEPKLGSRVSGFEGVVDTCAPNPCPNPTSL